MARQLIGHSNFPTEFMDLLYSMGLPRTPIEKLYMTVEPGEAVRFDIVVYAYTENGKPIIEGEELKRLTETYYLVKKDKDE